MKKIQIPIALLLCFFITSTKAASNEELTILVNHLLAENKAIKKRLDLLETPYFITGKPDDNGVDQSEGPITSRILKFTKLKSKEESLIRINYTDNIRVYNASGKGAMCQWEIRVNEKSCTPALVYQFHSNTAEDVRRSQSITGYCKGLKRGLHKIQIYLNSMGKGQANCRTGWKSTWALEAQEIDIRPKQVDTKNKKVNQ